MHLAKANAYFGLHEEITHKVIGAAMEVHKHLGNGFAHVAGCLFKGIRECYAFQEVVYQRALAIEINLQDIGFAREKEMPLLYKGYDVGTRRVDFFIPTYAIEGAFVLRTSALVGEIPI